MNAEFKVNGGMQSGGMQLGDGQIGSPHEVNGLQVKKGGEENIQDCLGGKQKGGGETGESGSGSGGQDLFKKLAEMVAMVLQKSGDGQESKPSPMGG